MIIYVYLIFSIVLYIYITFNLRKKIYLFLQKREQSIFIYNIINIIESFIIITFFSSYYIFYLRILVFFSKRNINLNFYDLKDQLISFVNTFCYPDIVMFLVFCSIVVFYIIFFFFNLVFFFLAKKHFLKLYYFYICRFSFIRDIIKKVVKLETYFYDIAGTYYSYFLLLRVYICYIILFFFFFKGLLIDHGDIANFLLFLPLCSLYSFIINIIEYLKKFKLDFDISIIINYYPKLCIQIEKNEYNTNQYIRYLVLGISEYKFVDCIYLEPEIINLLGENFLLINTYKYTINRYPNDFFSKIENHKPEFVVEKKVL